MLRATRTPSRLALGVLIALAAAGAPAAETDGVALVDSCGTYVRSREGTDAYQPSQLERGRLCADLLWDATQALKKRVVRAGERPPSRGGPLRCAIDPTPVGPHQAVRVAYKHLLDHPERLHLPAKLLAEEALVEAFGCTPAEAG